MAIVRRLMEELKAEKRWEKINEEARLRGCPCGKTATKSMNNYGVVGSVPHKWWTCDEHYGASTFYGQTALWSRSSPCDQCPTAGKQSNNSHTRPCMASSQRGEEPHEWHCPDK